MPHIDTFIRRWKASLGSERSNSQRFLTVPIDPSMS
jgi:hypothetical protein